MVDKLINVEAVAPRDKPYKIGVGGSMFLYILPSGSKYWRFSYRFEGKQKTLALGVYPEVSQLEAIEGRTRAKDLIKRGIDSADVRRDEKNLQIINAQKAVEAPQPSFVCSGFRLS